MKICVVQTRPLKGDIPGNIAQHMKFIDSATENGADLVIFPELSITGYEPKLARELATVKDDPRFDGFQRTADTRNVTIGIGAPTRHSGGICISMVIFQPRATRQTYSKKYIHPDEEPFFVSGESSIGLLGEKSDIAFAICYELSIPEHSANAFKSGAKIYVASVAKTADGVEKATRTLSQIAREYSMTVLMSNCVGPCDDFESGGRSAAWNDEGALLAQLNDTDEGFLIVDTALRDGRSSE
jgi:predicted amidohydrolase